MVEFTNIVLLSDCTTQSMIKYLHADCNLVEMILHRRDSKSLKIFTDEVLRSDRRLFIRVALKSI